MLSEADVFVTIAELAGVFVGFAALIGVARRSEVEGQRLAQVQAVVTIGLLVVVAALVPVGLAAYGLNAIGVWVTASVIYFVLNLVVSVLALRQPANRRIAVAQLRDSRVATAFFWLLEAAVDIPLLLVIVGVNRDLDMAFYLTSIVAHLIEAVFILAQVVFTQVVKQQAEATGTDALADKNAPEREPSEPD